MSGPGLFALWKTVREYVKQARAFLFPSEEPFGIAAVEAQACGTPVIAFDKGASREIIIDGETGIFFDRQDAASIMEAVNRFESIHGYFDPARIRDNAMRFSTEIFCDQFTTFVENRMNKRLVEIGSVGTIFRNRPERISEAAIR